MTRVLVTGGGGQLGRSIGDLVDDPRFAHLDVHVLTRAELDLRDLPLMRATVADLDPDVIVNAAAYTDVDRAEAEPGQAQASNLAIGPLAADPARRIVHLSTDYVFDGTKAGWYTERDPAAPLGMYGRFKLQSEGAVRDANPDHLILRTSWLYSPYGDNFVKTMLRLGTERDHLRVVHDQVGCPTSARDLADAILRLVDTDLTGTFHLAGATSATWYEFAVGIFDAAGVDVQVVPISTAEYPTRAPRPANSRLDSTAIREAADVSLPGWRTSLPTVIEQIRATTD